MAKSAPHEENQRVTKLAAVPEPVKETVAAMEKPAETIRPDASPKPVRMSFDAWMEQSMKNLFLPVTLKKGYVPHAGRRYLDKAGVEHETTDSKVKLPEGTRIALPLHEARPLIDAAKATIATGDD